MNDAAGNREQVKAQGGKPGVSTDSPPPGSKTGARTQGSTRNLGDLATSGENRNGGAKREAERVGARGVGVPQ